MARTIARRDVRDGDVVDAMDDFFLRKSESCDPQHDKFRLTEMCGFSREQCWITTSLEFTQLRDDKTKSLFWIKGSPGTGKTIQLCGLLDELCKVDKRSDITSFFFCHSTDSRKNSTAAVLRGLINTLVQQQPSLVRHICGKRMIKHQTKKTNPMIKLMDVFGNMLQDKGLRKRRIWFVVDSVDECSDMSSLLRLIRQTISVATNLKWVISSRSVPDIETWVQKSGDVIQLNFDQPREDLTAAINAYTRQRVQQLAKRNQYDTETECAIRKYLNEAGERVLWIALVCQSLEGIPQCDALAQLREIPPGLRPFYVHMMRRLERLNDGDFYKQILATVATVYRPITMLEMSLYIDSFGGATNELNGLTQAVQQCRAFVTVLNSTIYSVHSSARDYLLENLKASDGSFGPWLANAHESIFFKSLEHMKSILHRDMYHLMHPAVTTQNVRRPNPDPLAGSKYACIYWIDHLEASGQPVLKYCNDSLQGNGCVVKFFREKYLYWLECLSLLGCVAEGVCAMNKLLGFIVSVFGNC